MFISVIITAYNRRNFIKYAIRSVIDQDLPQEYYEIIVIVNFEEQEIIELAKEGRIRLIILKEGSVGEFILNGLRNSSGDIVTFLDDDDLYRSDRLRYLVETFEKYPEVVYYKNDIEYIDAQNSTINRVDRSTKCRGGIYERQRLLRNGHIQKLQLHLSTTAVKRGVLETFLKILPKMTAGQDVWFYYMAMSTGGLMYLDCKPLTYFRIHNLQTTNENNEFNHFIEGYVSIAQLENKIEENAVRNDLEKTRYRMLVLSASRGTPFSVRGLMSGFIFYLAHFSFNIRDARVVVYTIFLSLSTFLGAKNSGKIVSRITLWLNEAGLI